MFKFSFFMLPIVLGVSLPVNAAPIQVVTSFSILKNLVEEVGGPEVQVKSLIPSGVDPHGFNPRPSDVLDLKSADLFFTSGLGLDPWTAQLWKASKTKAPLIDVSVGLKALKSTALSGTHHQSHGHGHSHDHGHVHTHDHGPMDPHYWHDPARVRQVIDKITEALTQVRSDKALVFTDRARALKNKIQEIETSVRQQLSELKLKKMTALSPHDGFQYLGDAFGVRFVSVLGVSSAQDLSAARLAKVHKMLRQNEIQVAFFEKGHGEAILKPLLIEHQIPTEILHSDSLTAKDGGAESYIEFLQVNTDKLVKAFKLAGKVTP